MPVCLSQRKHQQNPCMLPGHRLVPRAVDIAGMKDNHRHVRGTTKYDQLFQTLHSQENQRADNIDADREQQEADRREDRHRVPQADDANGTEDDRHGDLKIRVENSLRDWSGM